MFNIGRKEIFISYLAYGLKFLSTIIVLPVILSSISSADFAIWSIFLAINTLVLLLDMGFGVVISRYTMYAYSGAEKINLDSDLKPVINASPNYMLLYQIMLASTKIYGKITKYAFFALIFMTIYIVIISYNQPNFSDIMVAWGIFFVSVCINIFILSEATIIKGLGKVKELQLIVIINSLVGIFIKITLLKIGLELIGLSIAYLLTALLLAIQYYRITNKVRKEEYVTFRNSKSNFRNSFEETYNSIQSKSKAMGGVVISNFLQNQLFLLVAPIFLSLELMSSYSLSWQLISFLGSIASIPFNTYFMKMGNQMISSNSKGLKETFSMATFLFMSIFIGGSIGLVFVGYELLEITNSNTELLPKISLILLIIYGFMNQSILKSINIISLSNDQRFVKSLVVSSILIIASQVILMIFTNNIFYIFLVSVIILASYNYWKWGGQAVKLCKVSYFEIVKIPIFKLLKKTISY